MSFVFGGFFEITSKKTFQQVHLFGDVALLLSRIKKKFDIKRHCWFVLWLNVYAVIFPVDYRKDHVSVGSNDAELYSWNNNS